VRRALDPFIAAKVVHVVTSGGHSIYSCLDPAKRAEIEQAFAGAGFAAPGAMADALFDRDQVQLFTGGNDPAYGGARIGGYGPEDDTLTPQDSRPLTAYEQREATKVFWGSLRMDVIEISEGGPLTWGGYARTTPDHVRFPNGSFGESGFIPWLIHELTHVWQYQHGAPLGNVIVSAFRGNYDYGGEPALRKRYADGDDFGDFGFEQQGDILQNYYEALVAGRDTSAFDPYLVQVRAGMTERLPPVKGIEPLPAGTLDVHALNEAYRAKVEAQIVAQLERRIDANDGPAVADRHHQVIALFRDLVGYWSSTYLERLDARRPDDVLVTRLHERMSRATVAEVRKLFTSG
jgi:hypothetical protein